MSSGLRWGRLGVEFCEVWAQAGGLGPGWRGLYLVQCEGVWGGVIGPFWAREAGRVWAALWTLGQSAGW